MVPVAVALVLALLPAPSGLPQHAWYFFAIFVGVIVGLVLEPLPGAAIALIGLTLITVLARFVLFGPEQLSETGFRLPNAALTWALSGYSNSTVWLIFGAFIIARGYDRTGLGERIALLLVKGLGKNTLLLGYGVTLADTILSPFGLWFKAERSLLAPRRLVPHVGSHRDYLRHQFVVSHCGFLQSACRRFRPETHPDGVALDGLV